MDARALALVGVLLFGAGFTSGYYTKARFAEAERVEQLEHQVQAAGEEVVKIGTWVAQSATVSQNIEDKVADTNHNIGQMQAAAVARVKAQEKIHESEAHSPAQEPRSTLSHSGNTWVFDVGTVRLLDAARANTHLDPATLSDAESQAASDVALSEFVANDLEVVKLYHELAHRHDTLVDYVSCKMTTPAESCLTP